MNWWQVTLLVALLVSIDVAVLGAAASMCAATLRPLAQAFPPVAPASDAVWRRFQSMSFDMLNFGGCVHIGADATHLHLRPARIARWFGLRDMSVPWSAVRLEKVKGKRAVAKVRGTSVRGPAWCLSLAGPAEGTR